MTRNWVRCCILPGCCCLCAWAVPILIRQKSFSLARCPLFALPNETSQFLGHSWVLAEHQDWTLFTGSHMRRSGFQFFRHRWSWTLSGGFGVGVGGLPCFVELWERQQRSVNPQRALSEVSFRNRCVPYWMKCLPEGFDPFQSWVRRFSDMS